MTNLILHLLACATLQGSFTCRPTDEVMSTQDMTILRATTFIYGNGDGGLHVGCVVTGELFRVKHPPGVSAPRIIFFARETCQEIVGRGKGEGK